MDFDEFKRRGLLREIDRVFTSELASRAVLGAIGFRLANLPPFGQGFWYGVCADIANGAIVGGLAELLTEAAHQFPGNPCFAQFSRQATAAPPPASQPAIPTASVQFIECDSSTALLDAARAAAKWLQIEATIGIAYVLETTVSLHFDTSVEDAIRISNAATESQGSRGRAIAAHPFRDYILDRLLVEGPDQDRFTLSQVPASTRAREIAKGIMTQYDDAMWPRDRHGRTRPSVVDRIGPDGMAERLSPDNTLHDSNVRDGDTLHVSPESTAGAVHPRIREEALARVRAQILDYASAHRDFEVFANASHAPTEYTFQFRAPGWGPPGEPHGAPVLIDEHKVFLSIPPEFPMKAPAVFWQSPRFHPNIDPQTGFVCLGELEDGYRPGMSFGELCQLLVDFAAYRNYELTEGYDLEAIAWAASPEGQLAIESRGGRSKIREVIADDGEQLIPPLRIQRLRP